VTCYTIALLASLPGQSFVIEGIAHTSIINITDL